MVKNYTKALTANPNPQEALRDSLSMYYSGNPVRGYRPDKEGDLSYVQKVVVGALKPSSADPIVPAVEATAGDEAIPVAVASPGARKTPVRARTASSKHSDPWVIVTDDNGQAPQPAQQAAMQPASPEQSRIQVALDTGDAAPVEQFQRFADPKPAAALASGQGQAQVEPSFVQIIN